MDLSMLIKMMMELEAEKRYKKKSFAWFRRVIETNGRNCRRKSTVAAKICGHCTFFFYSPILGCVKMDFT